MCFKLSEPKIIHKQRNFVVEMCLKVLCISVALFSIKKNLKKKLVSHFDRLIFKTVAV